MLEKLYWLTHIQVIGLPLWGWLIIFGVIALEGRLGRSKNPKWRSVADASHSFLAMLLRPTVGRIPGLGPLVNALFDALDPTPDEEPTPALAPVPAEEITKPETVPPPKPRRRRP